MSEGASPSVRAFSPPEVWLLGLADSVRLSDRRPSPLLYLWLETSRLPGCLLAFSTAQS